MPESKNFGLKAKHQADQEQEQLRTQYGVQEKDVIIVERRSRLIMALRALLGYSLKVLAILAKATIIVLAIIGLAALIFPDARAALLVEYNTAVEQLMALINN